MHFPLLSREYCTVTQLLIHCSHSPLHMSEAGNFASTVNGGFSHCNCTIYAVTQYKDLGVLFEPGSSWAGRLCRGACCMRGAQQRATAAT